MSFVRLYMHEIAMTYGKNDSLLDTVDWNDQLEIIDDDEFVDCRDAVHELLETFTSLDMATLRALPMLYYVRTVHGALALVKLHCATMRLDDPSERRARAGMLNTEHHLRSLLSLWSGWGGLWPATKFLQILMNLLRWFRHNGDKVNQYDEAPWLASWALKGPATIQAQSFMAPHHVPQQSISMHDPDLDMNFDFGANDLSAHIPAVPNTQAPQAALTENTDIFNQDLFAATNAYVADGQMERRSTPFEAMDNSTLALPAPPEPPVPPADEFDFLTVPPDGFDFGQWLDADISMAATDDWMIGGLP